MSDPRAAPGAQPEHISPAESLARELEARAYSPAVRAMGVGNTLMVLSAFLREQERRVRALEARVDLQAEQLRGLSPPHEVFIA